MRPVCPACGFIFFRDPKVACSTLVEKDGAVLLVKRAVEPKMGWWVLPGGYMEADEWPVTAAMRECEEESGVIVRVTELFGVFHGGRLGGAAFLIVYRAVPAGGALKPGDDASEARYFTLDEMPANIAFAPTRRALLRWCAERRNASKIVPLPVSSSRDN